MKKWVIGCLIVLVLLGVGGMVGTYFVYRWGKGKVDSYVTSVKQFGDVAKIEAQVSNKASFAAPANGELTTDQVDRFMKVQEGLETKMGARLKELDTKYQSMSKANGGNASLTETFGAISDLGSLIVEAKQTQFLREQEQIRQAELRRQREAEEARRRAEWEAEQDRLRAAAPLDEPAPVMQAAPPPPPPAAEPERTMIRGDYGAAVSGQKVWFHQIEDFEVAFMAVSNNEKVREAIDKAIANMVRGGVREIAGVRIWSDIKASNR